MVPIDDIHDMYVIRHAVASTRSAVIITDCKQPDNPIIYANKAFSKLTGYSEKEVIGRNCRFLQGAETEADTIQEIRDAVAKLKETHVVIKNYRKSGQAFWNDLIVSPVVNDDGEVTHFIGFQMDVSDKIRSSELRHTAKLLDDERKHLTVLNRAKDDFVSLASHQLRTPATAVKQNIGMILQGYMGDISEQQRKLLEEAYKSNERQLEIVDDLLQTARLDSGKLKLAQRKVDIVQLTQAIIDECAAIFMQKKQNVKFSYPSSSFVINGDSQNMRIALENIIENASKYSPKNTEIEIEIVAKPKKVLICVRDEGPGIAKKDLKKVFHKFTRLPNKESEEAGGSGLGLYWAKSIIELHGGSIEIESNNGKGTLFSISLPIKREALHG